MVDKQQMPMSAGGIVEELAQWLHDETSHPESYPNHVWPETERDDGQRQGGFVKIVPLHGQEYFRDIARRLVARFALRAQAAAPGEVVEKFPCAECENETACSNRVSCAALTENAK